MAIRVLIADDALFMRTLLKDILVAPEFEIVGEAVTGPEAIDKYRDLKPDLMTMDIVMPFKSGLEALKEIKAFDPKAKIIICSALGQEPMTAEAKAAGASAFIVKPIEDQDVLKIVHKVLSGAKEPI